MSEFIEFVEAKTFPLCPYCEQTLAQLEFRREIVRLGFLKGESFVILIICPHCHKVLGTQNWG